MELPPCAVFQCGNGHLLCKGRHAHMNRVLVHAPVCHANWSGEQQSLTAAALPLLRLLILLCFTDCHSRVLTEDRPSCPVCRVRLSRQRPSRNRFAEGVKSRLLVPCTQAGCSELVLFEQLDQHLSTQCGYRSAVCMFQPLGCEWSGIEINHEQHERKCKIRGLSAKDLLPLVRRRNEEYESQIQAAKRTATVQNHVSRHTDTDRTTGKSRAQLQADSLVWTSACVRCQLCHMLSKRCRDLCVRDLVIERDILTGAMCTKPFTACGLKWEVYLDAPPADQTPTEVKIHLQIGKHTRQRLHQLNNEYRSLQRVRRCLALISFQRRRACFSALTVDSPTRKTTIEVSAGTELRTVVTANSDQCLDCSFFLSFFLWLDPVLC